MSTANEWHALCRDLAACTMLPTEHTGRVLLLTNSYDVCVCNVHYICLMSGVLHVYFKLCGHARECAFRVRITELKKVL